MKKIRLSDGKGTWYTLSGQKLDKEPIAPGVYVKDGMKVVIK